jgi:Golgi SNAP receptor complex protein 2
MSSSSSHGNGLTPRYQLNNPPGESNAFNSSIHNNARTNHALDESSFMNQTGSTLDAYIAQGQAVLGNLAVQKDVLKGIS